MNATDLSCTENFSANQGPRGYRGPTGIAGVAEGPGTQGVPGQPGLDGGSRIDVSLRGVNGYPGHVVTSNNSSSTYADVTYVLFPGTANWGGDIQKIKIAALLRKQSVLAGRTVSISLEVEDVTNPLNPVSILSTPLLYEVEVTTANRDTIDYKIVQNGDDQNAYVTLTNLPTTEAVLRVRAKVNNGGKNPAVLYNIEIL